MAESQERRRFKRKVALTRAIIYFNDGQSNTSIKGVITEISCSGLGLRSHCGLFSTGKEVTIEVGTCQGLRSFQAKAIIRKIEVSVQSGETYSTLGLEFIRLNPTVFTNIERYVSDG